MKGAYPMVIRIRGFVLAIEFGYFQIGNLAWEEKMEASFTSSYGYVEVWNRVTPKY